MISVDKDKAVGEEEVEISDIDDTIRQVHIANLGNETLVYILHGAYWKYLLRVYSSNK